MSNNSHGNSFQNFFQLWLARQEDYMGQRVSSYGNNFENFFRLWLARQENYMRQLRYFSWQTNPQEVTSLVDNVLSHYQLYFEIKSRVVSQDVFPVLSPPWLSTFERTFLWIAGFKPTLAFRVMEKSVRSDPLTTQQVVMLKRLRARTTTLEKTLTDKMAMIQESIAQRSWVVAAMRIGGQQQRDDEEADELIESVRRRFRELVAQADLLRITTLKELVKILSPFHAAKFLAAITLLHLRLRAWGLQKDAERMKDGTTE